MKIKSVCLTVLIQQLPQVTVQNNRFVFRDGLRVYIFNLSVGSFRLSDLCLVHLTPALSLNGD